MANKDKYDWDVEQAVVNQAIADDEFIGTALERLWETMEKPEHVKAVEARVAAISADSEVEA